MKLESPLRYAGSKASVVKEVAGLALKHGTPETVVDVFTGGGSLLLHFATACPKAALVANDTHHPVAAFWRCMADPSLAARLCALLPDTVTQEQATDAMGAINDAALDDVTLAAAVVRSRTAHQGIMLRRAGIMGGLHGTNLHTLNSRYNAGRLRDRVTRIAAAVAGRLAVHEDDFATVVQRYDQPGTLLLLDPPYVGLGKVLYEKGFTDADHKRLADCLAALKHARWVMTNGMDSLTYSLYGNGKAVVTPLRVFGAHGSRLERMVAPRDAVWPDGVVKRVPVTDLQRAADVLAVHEHGPQMTLAVPSRQSKQPAKGKKARHSRPKPPVARPLTEEEAKWLSDSEAAIDKAMHGMLEGFVDIGRKLILICEQRLYRVHYQTFADYCGGRWHISRGRAYQLMRGVVAFEAIKLQFARRKDREDAMAQGLVPANEAQVRSLVPLLAYDDKAGSKAVCAVWKRVLGRTAAGDPLTAVLVAEEVDRWEAEHGQERRAPWDYDASPLGNLHRLELRIRQVDDITALDGAMAQLKGLLELLERQRAELAASDPQPSAPG